MSFGEKLKRIREQRGMTQDELGILLGTSKQVISRYETEQRTPKITVAEAYAKKLDVPLNYLIDDNASALTPRDNRDIARELETMRDRLMNEEGLMFDGKPASSEAVESILNAMELGMRTAKLLNKETYSPKKNRKDKQ